MAKKPLQILLQTTIPSVENDWHIGRFSQLQGYLASLKDAQGQPLCEVTARDRQVDSRGSDPVLRDLGHSNFDELWLFALDTGDGLTESEYKGINEFSARGGGLYLTRDHEELGSSLYKLGGVGAAHYFHKTNPDPDESRCCADDVETNTISWPNYHSGRNGDYQRIQPVEPIHELLRNPASPSGYIELFPAHPHEGGVGVPSGETQARVIAIGNSQTTKRPFNLVVAFEANRERGRAIADASFHHLVDYNWDTKFGAPDFVTEKPGNTMTIEPRAYEDLKAYIHNAALWLAPQH